jgi:hypothetical protein
LCVIAYIVFMNIVNNKDVFASVITAVTPKLADHCKLHTPYMTALHQWVLKNLRNRNSLDEMTLFIQEDSNFISWRINQYENNIKKNIVRKMNQDLCSFCMNTKSISEYIELSCCKKTIHADCYISWVLLYGTCSFCSTPVSLT